MAVLVFLVGRKGQRSRLTPLVSLAFAFAPQGEGLISSGALPTPLRFGDFAAAPDLHTDFHSSHSPRSYISVTNLGYN